MKINLRLPPIRKWNEKTKTYIEEAQFPTAVEGEELEIPLLEGFRFFIHKSIRGGLYDVTEYFSGQALTGHPLTRKHDAVQEVLDVIQSHGGVRGVYKAVRKSIKGHGLANGTMREWKKFKKPFLKEKKHA